MGRFKVFVQFDVEAVDAVEAVDELDMLHDEITAIWAEDDNDYEEAHI